ncbi:shikimate kinase [Sphingomonas suaedae]|uniref:Shikimate kinase n=1 Tax=Sphingomonas suaedae TaxID=2599297 RepID=A0A518RF76_9SPHN|nr:shikimate kinase [Sphingomonas suaedae]QDX26117.1 shikimate kinase [Sphingomonas suaedae]
MRLIFIYGPLASGKLTIGRLVAERMGLPLFHNHLIVDAVGAVFPFGSPEFVRLRQRFWLETISAAAISGRSLIFTFAPEPSVPLDFASRVSSMVADAGGQVTYIALELDETEQERRLVNPSRERFGKLRSLDVLRELRPSMVACMKSMPEPALRIDTAALPPTEAADAIVRIVTASSRTSAS